MKNMLVALALAIAMPIAARSATLTLADEAALAHDATYTIDTFAAGVGVVSAQVDYTSATLAPVAFTGGQVSTGVITVNTLSALSTSYAHGTVTVASTSSLKGTFVAFPGYVLTAQSNWAVGDTPAATALNIAAAITATVPGVVVSAAGAVVYATATYYGFTGQLSVTGSSNLSSTWEAGQSNAILTVNGVPLAASKDWIPGASVSDAATAIAGAINGKAGLAPLMTATANSPSTGKVLLVSKGVGAATNYSLASSTPTALAVTGFANGAGSSYSLGGSVLAVPSHGLTAGLPVLYGVGASPAIGGLTDQTTYYVAVVDANNIRLSDTKAHAVAGTNFVVFASSVVPAVGMTDSYSLTPLAISGVPGLQWLVSNDGVLFADPGTPGVSSVTVTSYSNPAASVVWYIGASSYRYVRLAVTGPTTGGLYLLATINTSPSALSSFVNRGGDTMVGQLKILSANSALYSSGTVTMMNGKVGIGTAAPAALLDVNGDVVVQGSVTATGGILYTPSDSTLWPSLAPTTERAALDVIAQQVYTQTFTLLDNQTSTATITSYVAATAKFRVLQYTIEKNSGMDMGFLNIISDGTTIVGDNTKSSIGATGVVLSKTVVGGVVYLSYTTTSTGADGIIKYRWTQNWN